MIWFHTVTKGTGVSLAFSVARVGARLVQAVLVQLPTSRVEHISNSARRTDPAEKMLAELADCELGMRRSASAQSHDYQLIGKQQERAHTMFANLEEELEGHSLVLKSKKRQRKAKVSE